MRKPDVAVESLTDVSCVLDLECSSDRVRLSVRVDVDDEGLAQTVHVSLIGQLYRFGTLGSGVRLSDLCHRS